MCFFGGITDNIISKQIFIGDPPIIAQTKRTIKDLASWYALPFQLCLEFQACSSVHQPLFAAKQTYNNNHKTMKGDH